LSHDHGKRHHARGEDQRVATPRAGVTAIVSDLSGAVADQGFIGLPISLRHGHLAGALPGSRRDPFDRMLIAQAILDDLVLVSIERLFDAYGVGRLW
jgi:PIN domain nuclease of toxin-antitoxin system